MTSRRILVRIVVSIAACAGLKVCGDLPACAQGLNRFHQGNSLTGPLINDAGGTGGVIHALAVDAGFPEDSQQMVKNAGIPVDWCWEKMNVVLLSTLDEHAPYDCVIIQPYGHQNTPPTEATEQQRSIYAAFKAKIRVGSI